MPTGNTATQNMPTREEILELAERFARREGFSPEWLTCPSWAGASKDANACLEKAGKFKKWAKVVLEKELPPPAWLAEEEPAFRDPELNRPEKNPNHLRSAHRPD